MLLIFKIHLPRYISLIVGWLGLVILISTGLVMNVESSFLGFLALAPVCAAILILLAGENSLKFGVEKFLGSKLMIYLGGLSYGLYL